MDGLTLQTEPVAWPDLEYCEACMLQYTLHSDSVFKNLSACYIAATYVFVLCLEWTFVDLCTAEASINIFNSINSEPSITSPSCRFITHM